MALSVTFSWEIDLVKRSLDRTEKASVLCTPKRRVLIFDFRFPVVTHVVQPDFAFRLTRVHLVALTFGVFTCRILGGGLAQERHRQ